MRLWKGFHKRKNYLFAGSDAGGDRAAPIYSLLGTAKLNGHNPEAFLREVLTRIAEHEDWAKMFSDTPAVTALLDRLVHHGHFLQIRGKSYRLHESSLAARAGKAKPAS